MAGARNFKIQQWLIYRLWRISQEAGYELQSFYSTEFGLSPVEWHSLAAIADFGPLSAKELAGLLDMNQVQMTRTLNRLLKQKMILRQTDEVDRRRVVLTLNKKGKTVYAQIAPKAQAVEDSLLKEFNSQERKQFLALLKRLEEKVN